MIDEAEVASEDALEFEQELEEGGADDAAPPAPLGDDRRARIYDLPVTIVVSVGKARLTVRELMAVEPQQVLALDADVRDPAEIFVGEKLVARGDLVMEGEEGEEQLGVRITEVCDGVE